MGDIVDLAREFLETADPKTPRTHQIVLVLCGEIERLRAVVEDQKSGLFAARTIRRQVTEFHRAFGQAIEGKPTVPDAKTIALRVSLIGEEFVEMLESIFTGDRCIEKIKEQIEELLRDVQPTVDLVSLVDAWADLDYVVEGSRLAFGIDGAPIAAEVHRSNMAKLGADGKPIVREDGKRLKPPGWTPPDIAGELRKQGWEG